MSDKLKFPALERRHTTFKMKTIVWAPLPKTEFAMRLMIEFFYTAILYRLIDKDIWHPELFGDAWMQSHIVVFFPSST